MEVIRSRTNPLVKAVKKLHQKKYRTQSYVIEGWHLLEEALSYGARIEHIFVDERYYSRVADLTMVRVVTQDILKELADSQNPQGVVAQIALPRQSFPENLEGRYLLLEDVQDPGNVGTMIRTADAAGYDAVFLSDKSADIYNMKVLRSMQGSQFHIPVYRVSFVSLLPRLKEARVPIFATTLSNQSVSYRTVGPTTCFALVMGNEGRGISEWMAKEADILVHIPMPGSAESLNVAVAAGIVLFSFI